MFGSYLGSERITVRFLMMTSGEIPFLKCMFLFHCIHRFKLKGRSGRLYIPEHDDDILGKYPKSLICLKLARRGLQIVYGSSCKISIL